MKFIELIVFQEKKASVWTKTMIPHDMFLLGNHFAFHAQAIKNILKCHKDLNMAENNNKNLLNINAFLI